MGLTIVWVGLVLIIWTFSVGVFFYIKGYTAAAIKSTSLANSLFAPYLNELAREKSSGALEKLQSLRDKLSFFRSTLERLKLGEIL